MNIIYFINALLLIASYVKKPRVNMSFRSVIVYHLMSFSIAKCNFFVTKMQKRKLF